MEHYSTTTRRSNDIFSTSHAISRPFLDDSDDSEGDERKTLKKDIPSSRPQSPPAEPTHHYLHELNPFVLSPSSASKDGSKIEPESSWVIPNRISVARAFVTAGPPPPTLSPSPTLQPNFDAQFSIDSRQIAETPRAHANIHLIPPILPHHSSPGIPPLHDSSTSFIPNPKILAPTEGLTITYLPTRKHLLGEGADAAVYAGHFAYIPPTLSNPITTGPLFQSPTSTDPQHDSVNPSTRDSGYDDTARQGHCAIKRYHSHHPGSLANIQQEISALTALRGHEHIIRYYGCVVERSERRDMDVSLVDVPLDAAVVVEEDEEEVSYLLVLELLSGTTLWDYVNDRRLTREEFNHIVKQIVSGLSFIHELGFVHGDIKLPNMMVSFPNARSSSQSSFLPSLSSRAINGGGGGDGRGEGAFPLSLPHITLFDFSQTQPYHQADGKPRLLEPPETLGTLPYSAPELLALPTPLAPSLDVYALGVCLVTLLNGGLAPWRGKSNVAMILHIRQGRFWTFVRDGDELYWRSRLNNEGEAGGIQLPSAALVSWIERSVAKNPRDRPFVSALLPLVSLTD